MGHKSLSLGRLLELLKLDVTTGKLYWKISPAKNVFIGEEAGYKNQLGYILVGINKRHYLAHRLVWAMYYDEWPTRQLDHIDGNPSNNKPNNLRQSTHQENMCNSVKPKNNTSGYKGVNFDKASGKWRAKIMYKKVRKCLGLHDSAEAAAKVYKKEADKLFGEFNRRSE